MSAAVVERDAATAPPPRGWLDEVVARWREVLHDPALRDLPYKIETNRCGQIVMSPAKNIHGAYQSALAQMLVAKLGGRTITECSVATPDGVKVAEVAWASQTFFDQHGYADPYEVAPAICVEIKSPSNARPELMAKVRLYLDAGAKEVWVVDEQGRVSFFDRSGQIEKSNFGVDVPPLT
jgi:Uma2 family endonuclease